MKKRTRRTRGLAGLLVALMLISTLPLPTAAVEGTDPMSDLSVEDVVQDNTGNTEESAEEPTEEPADEPAEEPVEEPTEEPAEEPTDEPAEEPVEEPTGEPVEEPASEQNEEVDLSVADSDQQWEGAGTEGAPYQISTVADLAELAKRVNAEEDPQTYEGQFFVLTNDIDLTDYLVGEGNDGGKGWEPIGRVRYSDWGNARYFQGTFDGQGNTISGLWINRVSEEESNIGLFGVVKNGIIRNLNVTIDEGEEIVGGRMVGGLIGTQHVDAGSSATVENCSVTGGMVYSSQMSWEGGLIGNLTVEGSFTVQACHTTVTVKGIDTDEGSRVGGLIGYCATNANANVTIEECYATGEVTGGYLVGGLVGTCQTYGGESLTIRNSYATGEVTGGDFVGGLVGACGAGGNGSLTIQNSYATGRTAGEAYAGGLVGALEITGKAEDEKSSCLIEQCYAAGEIAGGSSVGGLVGVMYTDNAKISLNDNLCLTKEITAKGTSEASRVLGSVLEGEVTLSNNYAYRSMMVNGAVISPNDTEYGADKFHGANVTAKELQTFAANETLEKFTTDVWDYEPGKLPVLKDVVNAEEQDSSLPFRYVEYFERKDDGMQSIVDEDWTEGKSYTVQTGAALKTTLISQDGKKYWVNPQTRKLVEEGTPLKDFSNLDLRADGVVVTFQSNGGTQVENEIVNYGGTVTKPAAPTRTDFTFAGWYSDETLTMAWNFEGTTVTKDITLYAKWTEAINEYTVTFESNGGSAVKDETVADGAKVTRPADPTRNGYAFAGWYKEKELTNLWDFATDTVTKDITLYAKWTENSEPENPGDPGDPGDPGSGGSGGGGGSTSTTRYTLDFDVDGGTAVKSVTKNGGAILNLANYKTSKDGYTFAGWYSDSALSKKVTSVTLQRDTTVYAKWTEGNTGTEILTHTAYLFGFGDGTIRPEAVISRAEVAQIFFRISGESVSHEKTFSDTVPGAWYDDAVSTMASKGVITGYSDGTFRPNAPISRAEFAALIARYMGLSGGEAATYSDVPATHWASPFIAAVQKSGYVSGYPDGTFRPEHSITRAEVAAIVNRMLGMVGDAKSIASVKDELKLFSDSGDTGKWFYYEMITATNSCRYRLDGAGHPVWVAVK